jgi:uncharacterized protein (DUF2384 family)
MGGGGKSITWEVMEASICVSIVEMAGSRAGRYNRGRFMPRTRKAPRKTEPDPGVRDLAQRLEAKANEVVKKLVEDPLILEYAAVLAHAVDTFGSRIKADAWLTRENRIFENRSPLQVLIQDPVVVEEELVRIDHGMIV